MAEKKTYFGKEGERDLMVTAFGKGGEGRREKRVCECPF